MHSVVCHSLPCGGGAGATLLGFMSSLPQDPQSLAFEVTANQRQGWQTEVSVFSLFSFVLLMSVPVSRPGCVALESDMELLLFLCESSSFPHLLLEEL